MKKLSSILIVLLAILLFPITALAVDYSIEKMSIDVELQEDGDVRVNEEQTYEFGGKFNGISRTLIPKKGTQIVNVSAYENDEVLEVEQDDNEFKVYRKGDSEKVTINFTYTIEEAITVYSDIAEFYWPFFDSGNESTYDQFDVTIHPPEVAEDVIAFGYDAAEESATIKSNGDVYFDLGKVSSGENGDIRVAYDNAIFPGLAITEDKAMRENLKAEHTHLINSRIAFEEKQGNLKTVVPYIIGVFALIFIGLILLAMQYKKTVMREVLRRFPAPYFVPKEYMSLPATIFFMKQNYVQPEVLSAALMDLVRKGYLEETKDESFTVINRNPSYNHERFLIDWLFDKIGDGNVFKVEDLNTYIEDEKNQETYQEDYAEWQKAVKAEQADYDLFSKNAKIRLTAGVIALLIIPLIIFLGVYELYFYMFVGIILSIAFLAFAAVFKTLTVTGARIKRDWKSFESKYSEVADDEWEEMNTDEQKRAFIYGVGVKDKKIDKANKVLLNKYPTGQIPASNPMYTLLFLTTINTSFSKADETSAASIASTGSAGAGAGVGGGGGGSGAF